MKTTPLWSPPQGAANTSRMAQFMAEINAEFGVNLQSFADLHGFSVRETKKFWSKAWDFLGVIGEKGGGPILRLGERFEDAKFFEGARLNYAENLLRKDDGNTALIFWGGQGQEDHDLGAAPCGGKPGPAVFARSGRSRG